MTPALSWLENVSIFRYFGRMFHPNLSRISSCGRQFLTCGGPSSSRSSANRAADMDRPRMPSPHSFSALCRRRRSADRAKQIFQNAQLVINDARRLLNISRASATSTASISSYITSLLSKPDSLAIFSTRSL